MEKKVTIPEKVDVNLENRVVEVSGQKGSIKKDFDDPRFNKYLKIERHDNQIIIKTDSEKRKIKSLSGTIVSHINNMITGITKGFRYEMKIIYKHFPITVSVKDRKVEVRNFLGEKGARTAKIRGNADVKIEKDTIIITGINLEDVSQTAANIEKSCKLSKRDKRIFTDGIYLTGKFLQTGEAI